MSIKKFAERLWTTRQARGLRVTELNDAAEMSVGSLTRIETAQRTFIEAGTLCKLAEALGVTMEWLWTGREEPLGADFLRDLEKRGLREVIEREPNSWTVHTISRAMARKVPCDKSGVPIGGWVKLLNEVASGTAIASGRGKRRPESH